MLEERKSLYILDIELIKRCILKEWMIEIGVIRKLGWMRWRGWKIRQERELPLNPNFFFPKKIIFSFFFLEFQTSACSLSDICVKKCDSHCTGIYARTQALVRKKICGQLMEVSFLSFKFNAPWPLYLILCLHPASSQRSILFFALSAPSKTNSQ